MSFSFARMRSRRVFRWSWKDPWRDLPQMKVDADSVAAVVVEPVLGEGGFVAPPREFFQALREICTKHGIVLVADEVQTGFGRTGTLFACEQLGIEPDLTLSAKSIAAGLPLGAVTGRAEIMDAPVPGLVGVQRRGQSRGLRSCAGRAENV